MAEGRLQSHRYTGEDGSEKTSVEIVLEKVEMLDSMLDGSVANNGLVG
jgi:single-stranded DNA-binding protein